MNSNRSVLPGLLMVGIVLFVAMGISQATGLARIGISAAALGILLGVLVGNSWQGLHEGRFQDGIAFAQKHLLRWGIVLFGFHLSLQQVLAIGESGIAVDIVMVVTTLALGVWLGKRWFGLDMHTALLTAVGSAICGAAAIAATAPSLNAKADKVTSAVGTVVLFGTLGMVIYPVIDHLGLASLCSVFGVYVGSTVHEVAQVVAIGNWLNEDAAQSAVIVKMLRVLMLMPFLVGLSLYRNDAEGTARWQHMPWFALVFVAVAGINSLHVVPAAATHALQELGAALLAAGMIALGLGTTLARIRAAGIKPILLGGLLFVHLVLFGAAVNSIAAHLHATA